MLPGLLLAKKLGTDAQLTQLLGALHDELGLLLQLPMVLHLQPELKEQALQDSRETLTEMVNKVPMRIRLKKEQERLQQKIIDAEIDKVVEEFEMISISSKRKGHK